MIVNGVYGSYHLALPSQRATLLIPIFRPVEWCAVREPFLKLGYLSGLMPSTGLCRVMRVNGSGAATESWGRSA